MRRCCWPDSLDAFFEVVDSNNVLIIYKPKYPQTLVWETLSKNDCFLICWSSLIIGYDWTFVLSPHYLQLSLQGTPFAQCSWLFHAPLWSDIMRSFFISFFLCFLLLFFFLSFVHLFVSISLGVLLLLAILCGSSRLHLPSQSFPLRHVPDNYGRVNGYLWVPAERCRDGMDIGPLVILLMRQHLETKEQDGFVKQCFNGSCSCVFFHVSLLSGCFFVLVHCLVVHVDMLVSRFLPVPIACVCL